METGDGAESLVDDGLSVRAPPPAAAPTVPADTSPLHTAAALVGPIGVPEPFRMNCRYEVVPEVQPFHST